MSCEECKIRDAEIADLKALIAKRANVRVSVHDVWLRERARREKAEAEIARLRALVAAGREMASQAIATQGYDPRTYICLLCDGVGFTEEVVQHKYTCPVGKWRSLEGERCTNVM